MDKRARTEDFLDQSFRHRFEPAAGEAARPGIEAYSPGIEASQLPVLAYAPGSSPSSAARDEAVTGNDPASTAVTVIRIGGIDFVLRGNVVSCACPDCSALMSVRIWLGLADCWRCGCGIELDLEEQQSLRDAMHAAAPTPASAKPSRLFDRADPMLPVAAAPADPLADILTEARTVSREWPVLPEWLPAWAVSFLLHVLLIVLLAVLMLRPGSDFHEGWNEPIELVLSPFLSELHREGGTVQIQPPETGEDDQAVLRPADREDPDVPEDPAPETDAESLQADPAPISELPPLDVVRAAVSSGSGAKASLLARDPRLREEIVFREGGTSESEAAVARGLQWLASVQNADGSWSLSGYARHDNPRNRGDAAGTGLALLPFLGAGQTQEFGLYKQTVANGLQWLIDHQKDDGDLRHDFEGQAGMYAHGQCAIVLCEAYALTGDERLRDPAQRAIDFIVKAQHRTGGWRYFPGQEGDTSVFGWQLMALQSAREIPSLRVPVSALRRAEAYLDRAGKAARSDPLQEDGVLYRYQPDEDEVRASMTAEAILCRMYLGWKRDDPRVMRSVQWLAEEHPPTMDSPDLYYWYYATQVMHHFGGQPWADWNRELRDLLVDSQIDRGPWAGSWDHKKFEWGSQGGRIFVTSFAVCTLEVYYRRLPLFRKLMLERSPEEIHE